MSNFTKLLQQAAAGVGGAGLDVTEVFSIDAWNGTSASHDIENGIDLSNEGGLLWIKKRNDSTFSNHVLYDSERTYLTFALHTDFSEAEGVELGMNAFNTDGYSLTNDSGGGTRVNTSGYTYCGWTFRKAPKFFDIVTYTGTGSAQNISHNLNTTVGAIFVKCRNIGYNWAIYHRGSHATAPEDYRLPFSTSGASDDATAWNDTAPTSTQFTVGTSALVNQSGQSYVAYIFAHNDGDGDFGPQGNQDIIKCGSFAVSGSATAVDLGFEPQYVLVHNTVGSNWYIMDNLRGFAPMDGTDPYSRGLRADSSSAENNSQIQILSNGFSTNSNAQLGFSGTCVYIAIRRGPLAVPDNATDMFDIATKLSPAPGFDCSFPVDMAIMRNVSVATDNQVGTRLIQERGLATNTTSGQNTSSFFDFDFTKGWSTDSSTNSSVYSWMWRRVPSFFDVAAYTGNGTAGHTITHNLGVVPEMIWCKRRDTSGWAWPVYHSGIANDPETDYLLLDSVSGASDSAAFWNDTAPTASDFTVGTYAGINASGGTYIAYLFASLAGVSKVGSYTGNGTSQNIDCGFSSGARFVLVKRSDGTSNWVLWDSERGIVAGNDPFIALNGITAQNSSYDSIDPYSGGFAMNETSNNLNVNGASYVFYAIA